MNKENEENNVIASKATKQSTENRRHSEKIEPSLSDAQNMSLSGLTRQSFSDEKQTCRYLLKKFPRLAEGVEFKPLWELTVWDKKFNAVDDEKQSKVLKYYYYFANDLKPLINNAGDIKILTTSITNLYTSSELVDADTVSNEEIVAIPGGGNPIVQYYNGKFITADNRIAVSNDTNILNTKYLYYVLMNKLDEIGSFYRGAGIKHPNMAKVLDLSIPLPPLAVQQEIVHILDKFTELEKELEKELVLRRKQYEYYRDKLISEAKGAEWKTLGEVFTSKNGYTPSTKNDEYWNGGTIPWFVMDDIRTNGRVLSDSKQHITKKAVKSSGLFKKNSLIVATSATVGEHALITVDFLCNQRFTCLYPKPEYEDKINMKYFFYCAYQLDEYCKKNLTVSTFASVDMTKFYNFRFPLPPLSEQTRIVQILDKFESLVNSLTDGIPAEIKLRKKQYEYYRDLLLTFKRK